MLIMTLINNIPVGGDGLQLQLGPRAPQRDVQLSYGHGPKRLQRIPHLARDAKANFWNGKRIYGAGHLGGNNYLNGTSM